MKCKGAYESVEHYLLFCELSEREKNVLQRKVRIIKMRVDKLLGNLRNIEHTVEFIRSTRRFTFELSFTVALVRGETIA